MDALRGVALHAATSGAGGEASARGLWCATMVLELRVRKSRLTVSHTHIIRRSKKKVQLRYNDTVVFRKGAASDVRVHITTDMLPGDDDLM